MLRRVKTSVESSVKDGICWAGMFGLAEPYLVPFALNLGASNLLIGVVRSLPVFLSSFAQFFTEFLVYRLKSCKKVVYWSVFLQALSLFFSAFCAFAPENIAVYLLIFFLIFYAIGGSVASAPWYTLMGEYLPSDKRGEFFGFRNRLIAISYFTVSFLASLYLNFYGEKLLAFFVIFISAALFRFGSVFYISRMYESPKRFHIPKTFSGLLFNFKTEKKHSGVLKIFTSVFILLFFTYMAAPYFSVYVLKELKFNYVKYMLIMSVGQFLTWMLMKNWGTLLDKKGTLPVIKYAFWFIPFVSLLWMFGKNFYYLFSVEVFSGIAWGAFGLGVTNLVYEYLEPSLRTRYNSILILIMSIAQFSGSVLGGFFYDKLRGLPFSPFIYILGISTAGRFLALLHFSSVKKEMAFEKNSGRASAAEPDPFPLCVK